MSADTVGEKASVKEARKFEVTILWSGGSGYPHYLFYGGPHPGSPRRGLIPET